VAEFESSSILTALSRHHVDHVLIGGLAVLREILAQRLQQ